MRSYLAPLSAGFVTVLVGFTSSAAIVFQAAEAAGATPAQISSWMWALGIAMGVTCIGLSLRYRAPVVTAWSTPGAALLVTALAGVSLEQATGAFMFCAVLILLAGVTRGFERVMDRIPPGIAAAMLAGVLVRFGIEVFVAMGQRFGLVFAMFVAYLLARRLWPRYAVLIVLALGSAVAAAQGLLNFDTLRLETAAPVFTMPEFDWQTMIGVGVPLFVVTMTSQNVPGVAVMRAAGYGKVPVSPVVSWTGAVSLVLAPFGCFAINLAAITAAICMGREAHEDPAKRYLASVFAGVFYLLVGVFGATVGALFAAFPRELVLAVAGLALFGTIGGGLATAMKDEAQREPALVTFLVTASGLSLGGIGSAFWGVVAGALALWVLNWRK
ncbi:MAG: benzoate rane transport protein [Thauera sp.]|jgi:benzoate membrane transport protein|uniref:benzoate/H(+) symporter BenE family transporter n=1 Tax=Thauera propionica TaxID=2019431 RepID=UPI0023F45B8F|nr:MULTISPECIES: benzoate/H(+) symporter BenE family transporter [Thauera]MDD3676618.1 benzoate/H(+) symporter BenE family transporter [Thauera propionica]MDI3491533.1 benzoate rane transport protein [Thauera sp.]